MDVRKKVLLAGIEIAMLSAAIATQYARVSIAYEYGISANNGAIRFIARDTAPDGKYVLQNVGNTLKLSFGSFTPGTNKTYTAAFGIVNEESFNIYLYNVSVMGSGSQYVKIWLHKNPNVTASNDASSILVWDGSHKTFSNITFYAGNNDASNAYSDAGMISTPLDVTNNVRYNTASGTIGNNNDYWWVQVSIDIPNGVSDATYTGNILFSFTSVQ